MKKKTKSIIAMGLVCTMLSGVLSGCGKAAETVNQQSGTTNSVTNGKVESAAPENASAEPAESTKSSEIRTDGNIVLYAEKGDIVWLGVFTNPETTYEDINVEIAGAEADIPLYSLDGSLCGYLKEGGSIVVTEHLRPATAWYRFENPIAGTEEEYLYIRSYETIMSYDLDKIIGDFLVDMDGGTGKYQVVDAPEADMECYEFSIEREFYFRYNEFIYTDEFNASKYRTFYVESTRNGDYFDIKVYYK